MFKKSTNTTRLLLLAGYACLTGVTANQANAAAVVQLNGAIAGVVKGPGGIPQIGATIILYSHLQRPLAKVLTDEKGEFRLPGLLPALYTVKVSFTALIPVSREILVEPGMRSMLNVNLSTLFSNIQFGYPSVESGSLMTEDWKWVLRSAPATRPIMRLVETANSPAGSSASGVTQAEIESSPLGHASVFADTRGLVNVSAGDGSVNEGVSTRADLGTTFALATSVYGNSLVQFSGNFGYGTATGAPAAAFRTSFSREVAGGNPEVSLTVRQLMLPGRIAAAFAGDSGLSLMRSMSAGLRDESRISDNLTLQYGFTMDVVSFLDHLNYYSPYARLTYDVDPNDELIFAYTSGNARPDLDSAPVGAAGAGDSDLRRDVEALGVFPRMSVANGRARIQRGVEYEAVYVRRSGSRAYRASIYRQDISNAAVTMAAPGGFFSGGDLLPDLFSNSWILNAGTFQSTGVALSATQNIGDNASATVIYGDSGALTTSGSELVSHSPDELRAMIRQGRRQSITTRVAATAPHVGTHLVASYQWTGDKNALMAGNLYSTAGMQPLPGMNVFIRQPIPGFGGRVEATADLRNILAQGYLPLTTADGQRILLVQNPRSVRGGLSFTF
jgi:hypothetical protein